MFRTLENYIHELVKDFDKIPQERKKLLEQLGGFVESKIKNGLPAKLIFICTHNSRRSHISQIWGQTAAYYYEIKDVECYSGGTEATAFNPRAVKAMEKAGFLITPTGNTDNPVYQVKFSENGSTTAFSKKYDAAGNPTSDFCAVMTCTHADENCPFIPGATLRLPISYNDPKEFDDTPLEEAKYDERCMEIGREILYAFSAVKK